MPEDASIVSHRASPSCGNKRRDALSSIKGKRDGGQYGSAKQFSTELRSSAACAPYPAVHTGIGTGIVSPVAGVVSTTATNARQIQFGLSLEF